MPPLVPHPGGWSFSGSVIPVTVSSGSLQLLTSYIGNTVAITNATNAPLLVLPITGGFSGTIGLWDAAGNAWQYPINLNAAIPPQSSPSQMIGTAGGAVSLISDGTNYGLG